MKRVVNILQLNITTDYAIRSLLYLAIQKKPIFVAVEVQLFSSKQIKIEEMILIKINTADINAYLDAAGIKHSHNGFRYLSTAIEVACQSQYMPFKTTDLYETVAKQYNNTSLLVERSIRYSLQGKNISNKEFVARAKDQILNK